MRAAVVIASVMCMRLSSACIWLVRTSIHGAEVVGCWTHSAHGRMQNRGTGEWLVPGPCGTTKCGSPRTCAMAAFPGTSRGGWEARMPTALSLFLGLIGRLGRSRRDLLLENLALRHQLTMCERRPRVTNGDRWLWAHFLGRWSGWRESLLVLHPDTVVRWQRSGWRRYWGWKSRARRPLGPKMMSGKEKRSGAFFYVAIASPPSLHANAQAPKRLARPLRLRREGRPRSCSPSDSQRPMLWVPACGGSLRSAMYATHCCVMLHKVPYWVFGNVA